MIRKKKINSPKKNEINQQELVNYWSCLFKKWKQKNKNKWICFSHNIISEFIGTLNSNTNSNTQLEYNETENFKYKWIYNNYKKDETTKDTKKSNQPNENNTLNTYSKRLFATTQNNTFPPALPDILNLPNNNSSDHSPHNFIKNQQLQQLEKPEQQQQQEQQNTHYQRTPNTLKSISFPEKLIFAHPEKFGIVEEDKNNSNYTHVYLYRHEIALTPNELTQMEKNYINYNKPKVYKLHNYVNAKKKKMLRCPLRSCQHKILNNVFIKESLSQHCANYHNNDLKHYIFYYKINHKWETFFYPPLHLQNNPREQNPPTCQNQNNETSPVSIEQINPNQTKSLKKTSSQTDKFLFNTQPVFSQSEQIFIRPPPGLI